MTVSARCSISAALALALSLLSNANGQATPAVSDSSELPGVRSWTEFRGGPLNLGESFSPRPAYSGVKWKYFCAGPVSGTTLVAQGKVIAATELGHVHAIDAETGKKVWSATVGPVGPGSGIVFASPYVAGDRVLVPTRKGQIVCFRLDDGEELWRYDAGGKEIYSSLKGNDDVVVFATLEPAIHGIHPKTGQRIWRHEILRETGASAGILAGNAYFATKDSSIYEIDLSTGQRKRRIALPGTSHCTPALALGYAFLIVGGRKSVGVDLLTEEVVWTNQATSEDKMAIGFKDGIAFFPMGQFLWAINGITGEKVWEARAEHKVTAPTVNGDDVVFAGQDGWLRVVDRATGAEKKAISIGQKMLGGPTIVGGKVYVGTLDDYVFCIE